MRYISSIVFLILSVTLKAQQKNIYYPSGFVHYSYDVKNEKLNGEFASYYENGLISAKGSFTNGQKTGKWQAWDSSGILRTSRMYRNNSDFDLLAEWTQGGNNIPEENTKKKNEKFHAGSTNISAKDIIYIERYWKRILPGDANKELFSDEFNKSLEQEIASGNIHMFQDDRFVHLLSPAEAATILKGTPSQFVLKEQHSFFATSQQMQAKIIGLGLLYKNKEEEITYWLYYPDMEPALQNMPEPALLIAGKISAHSFITEIDMTTYRAVNYQPRKVSENEKIVLLLREADYEAQVWIYLLDKELMANR